MGLSPSEKSKILRDVRELKESIDAVNQAQDKAIMDINGRIDAISKRVADIGATVNQLVMDSQDTEPEQDEEKGAEDTKTPKKRSSKKA